MLEIGNATQNAAVAYALVGAIQSLILGVTAGCLLGRFSIRRVLTAGSLASFWELPSALRVPMGSLHFILAEWERRISPFRCSFTWESGRPWGQRRALLSELGREVETCSSVPWSEESSATGLERYCSTYLAYSYRWHIPKGHFPKRPARDWRQTSLYVYAWRSGSWLSRIRRVAPRPTRLDVDAFLHEPANDRQRTKQGRLPRGCSWRPILVRSECKPEIHDLKRAP